MLKYLILYLFSIQFVYSSDLTKLPKDNNIFTQGLYYFNNQLLESSGLYGKSYIINHKTSSKHEFPDSIFIEDIVVLNGVLYALTWKENIIYSLDPNNLTIIEKRHYPYIGWGLTSYRDMLIASDGTSQIRFIDPASLKVNKTVDLGINYINSLYVYQEYLLFNVFGSDYLYIYDLVKGKIINHIYVGCLRNISVKNRDNRNVTNGIAVINNNVLITGKLWNYYFSLPIEVVFNKNTICKK